MKNKKTYIPVINNQMSVADIVDSLSDYIEFNQQFLDGLVDRDCESYTHYNAKVEALNEFRKYIAESYISSRQAA